MSPPDAINPDGIVKMGRLLDDILNHNYFIGGVIGPDFQEAILEDLFRSVGRRIDPGKEFDPSAVAAMLSSYSYDVDDTLLYDDPKDYLVDCEYKDINGNATNLCRNGKSCSKYCEMASANKIPDEVILELFEMSVPHVNALNGEGSKSLLPGCRGKDQDQCWTRVVTDRGVCFSSYDKG